MRLFIPLSRSPSLILSASSSFSSRRTFLPSVAFSRPAATMGNATVIDGTALAKYISSLRAYVDRLLNFGLCILQIG